MSMQADTLLEALGDIREIDARATIVGFPDFQIDERIDRNEFNQNYNQWLNDSIYDSLPELMRAHQSYQVIIAMGERAIPVIAAELRKQPSFLFLALEDITGDDPVPDEAEGDLRATVEAWLEWLRR